MEKRKQDHTHPQDQAMSTNHGPHKASAQMPISQAPARPATSDPTAWEAYWKELHQPWRTEPEISQERQRVLEEHLAIVPDIQQGIYPFRGIPLTRVDIEWLLTIHHKEHGPINESEGLDLRGADLHNLPLARMRGGLSGVEMLLATEKQQRAAAILLRKADLHEAQLQGADLHEAQLQGADLRRAQLQGAYLGRAQLENTSLDNVFLCDERGIGPRIADVQWGNTNLAVVDWSKVQMLGDEYDAHQKTTLERERKDKDTLLDGFRSAVRANRQLAVALQSQGLNEEASRFAYRAQRLQRTVLRLQRKWGQYLFYTFLEALAGYGYRPIRTVLWYLGMISLFALAYHYIGGLSLYPPDAFVYSLTSFHGRGFFPGLDARPSLHDPLIMLAALEAVIGLFIEISFIATFTQRFFGK
jgi:Pentapeptide repeats (8 copies)